LRLTWCRYYNNKVPHTSREVGSFWWKDILFLDILFWRIARCSIITFWEDNRYDVVLAEKYPILLSFALDVNIVSVKPTLEAEHLDDLFQLPLSEQEFLELQAMQSHLQSINLDNISDDLWSFIWGNGNYSSRKYYGLAFQTSPCPPDFHLDLEIKMHSEIKIFAWLQLIRPSKV
jgi:hypothetical protein